jgi:hypothetical protein
MVMLIPAEFGLLLIMLVRATSFTGVAKKLFRPGFSPD